MPMINCPECKERISDKATACPKCGYPLQEDRELSLYDVLVGRRWRAQSQSLAGQGLDITFMRNGEFSGQLTGTGSYTPPQPVTGKWQVIESQLFLDYVYTMYLEVQVIPSPTQFQIQITQGTESRLLGVDRSARAWEWVKVG
ncbi:zinc-ribbon domain-containing protein [bacterium]|nr:zinc-ribbon domain-containing protein [bacterium]